MAWRDWVPPVITSRFAAGAPVKTEQGEVAWADPTRLYEKMGGIAFSQYNPSKLTSRQGLEIYDKMRLDDQVKAALTFKKHAVLSPGWDIVNPEGVPQDWEPTMMIREMFNELDGSLYDALLGVLTAFDFGYSITEKIYQSDGARVRLSALKTRKPHSFDFHADVYGNLMTDGLRQRQDAFGASSLSVGGALGVPLPIDKFVLFANEMEFGNWYGRADLEAAYRPWLVKDHAYRWLAMFLERLGIPPVFALYDPNLYTGGVLADLKQIFAALQAGTSGVIPRKTKDSLEFWSPQLASQVRDVFLPSMQRFDADIARGVLLPQLLGFTSDVAAGSFARAEVHQESFFYVIRYIQNLLADRVMNEQIIRPVCALNFAGLTAYPIFKFKPLDEQQRQSLMDRWLKAVTTGVIIPQAEDEVYARELTKFPTREIPDDQVYTVRGGVGEQGFPVQHSTAPPSDPAPVDDDDPVGQTKTMTRLGDVALLAECERLVALSR